MNYIIHVGVFIVVLITYLHIQSHFQVAPESDVFELDGIIDARIEDVLDLKQPVVFRLRTDTTIEEDMNIHALVRMRPDTDVCVVDAVHGTRVSSSIVSFLKLQESAGNMSYYSDGNENVIQGLSNDIRERIASHYLQLMPPLSYISRYDLIFGTDNCVTALRRHVAHRSYFTVTNGTVGAKLIHPEHLTDVSFGCTPEMTSDMWSSVAKLDTSISTVKDVSLHRGQTLFVPPYWGVIFHMTKDSFMLSVKYSTYMTEMATCLHTFRFWYHKMTTRPTVVPDVHVATDPSSSSADIIPDGVNDMNEMPVSDNICINNEDEPEDK